MIMISESRQQARASIETSRPKLQSLAEAPCQKVFCGHHATGKIFVDNSAQMS